jgi:hypothetical protein
MNLFFILSDLENNDELHEARLLVLLGAFVGKKGVRRLNGLTKLAKLDFLLRYPVFLERALRTISGANSEDVDVLDYERQSVESSMVRYRYGPWDFRYRRFINILIAKGLVVVEVQGRTIHIGLTDAGLAVAQQLVKDEAHNDIANRSRLLKKHFDWAPTRLMKFIYATFPEIGTLRLGEEIEQ